MSKKLESKAPDGVVTEPSTVTTVPAGRARASAIEITCGAALAGIATEETATKASSSAGARTRREFREWVMEPSFLKDRQVPR